MAKKAATNSPNPAASPARTSKKKTTEARAPKHVKAKAVAVAAAVEGFVSAIVNPSDAELRKPAKTAERAEPAFAVDTTVEQELASQPAIVDQSVAAVSRPGLGDETEAGAEEVTKTPATQVQAEVTDEDVRKLAYIYYLDRRGKGGSEAEDWIRAEQALRAGSAA